MMRRSKPAPRLLSLAVSILTCSLVACSHSGSKQKPTASLSSQTGEVLGDNSTLWGKQSGGRWAKRNRTHAKGVGAKYDSLWERLFDLYDLPPVEHPDIQRELDFFANKPDFLDRVQTRAEPFLYSIVRQVEKQEVPGELALLPVIESAFKPHAVSPAHAAGIWQFIPSTGRHYGLKQSRYYDGRRDIYASTRAAIKYLKKLHNDFNGDWLLAIAGYNCGEGAVSRAIERNLARGLPTDFWSLDLPSETRSYVPRLLAVSRLFADAERFGVALHRLPNKPVYKPVKVTDQVDLALAADAANISLDEMLALNPGFKRPYSDIGGTYRLFIPAHKKAADFKRELARLSTEGRGSNGDASFFARGNERSSAASASGSPLSPPAEDPHPATGASVRIDPPPTLPARALAAYSPPEDHPIAPLAASPRLNEETASAVVVPESDPKPSGEESNVIERTLPARIQHRRREPEAVFLPPKPALSEGGFVAQPEDRGPIRAEPRSRRHHREVVKANRIHETVVAHVAPPPPPPVPLLERPGSIEEKSGKHATYTVKNGDTLYSIARKRGIDVEQLAKWNDVPMTYEVKRGQDFVVGAKRVDPPAPPQSASGHGKRILLASASTASHAVASSRSGAHENDAPVSSSRHTQVAGGDAKRRGGSKAERSGATAGKSAIAQHHRDRH